MKILAALIILGILVFFMSIKKSKTKSNNDDEDEDITIDREYFWRGPNIKNKN